MGATTSTKEYIWIDYNINKYHNSITYNNLFNKKKCKKFENIRDFIRYISNNYISNNGNNNNNNNNIIDEYKNIVIIVSGSLYMDFYFEFKKLKNIKITPTIIVYLEKKRIIH